MLLDAGHHERGVALERIAALSAAGAAERLRLPGKGRLAPGADADAVLVNLGGETAVTEESLFQRHPHSPYLGRTLRGRIERTLVRGTTVFAGRLVIPATERT